jgi:hypothetical protein
MPLPHPTHQKDGPQSLATAAGNPRPNDASEPSNPPSLLTRNWHSFRGLRQERESHYLWGKRYLLRVIEDAPHSYVAIDHRNIELGVPKGANADKRQAVLDSWYRQQLREAASARIDAWQKRLGVDVDKFFIQRMRTKWGGSSPQRRTIRLNLELAKKDIECLDYVILHELAHFLVPNHSEAFISLLDRHMPNWRHVRKHLNDLPLGHTG